MRVKQLRDVDLNLLVTFAVVAEERSITAAAERLLLSQPAVSRALGRARVTFGDELLVRGPRGLEPTPHGRKLLAELEQILPRLDALVTRTAFDPLREAATFRISGPDNACTALLPSLLRQQIDQQLLTRIEVQPWQESALDQLERGQLDLILLIEDGLLPPHLQFEPLYREEWVCLVDRDHPVFGSQDAIALESYLAHEHIAVSTLPGVQSLPEKRLAALGHTRRNAIRMPYFGAALACVPETPLVLTATTSMLALSAGDDRLRVLDPPKELTGFDFRMVWHPRLTHDLRHQWLRESLRSAAATLG
jgi:DNA-binding transcriptional LysR family regulator